MSDLLHPRVLVAAGPERTDLPALFGREPLAAWELQMAESFAQARHHLQYVAFDLLIVGAGLLRREGPQALAWLLSSRSAPILFLGDDDAALYLQAHQVGVASCLPWKLAMDQPPLLGALMQQAMRAEEMTHQVQRLRRQGAEARRHVDRLVQLIWQMTPRHDDYWYSQRHMLERLHEEILRCQRHRVPLSIAVGELDGTADATEDRIPDWAAESIVRGKRRSDIVGQYGPSGFLLLMVHTPKPGGVTCCRRLHDHLEQPTQGLRGPHLPMRSFFGIASMDAERNTPQALLRIADQNLEMARNAAECVVAE